MMWWCKECEPVQSFLVAPSQSAVLSDLNQRKAFDVLTYMDWQHDAVWCKACKYCKVVHEIKDSLWFTGLFDELLYHHQDMDWLKETIAFV